MNQGPDRHDVVIVGARCGGAAAAMLLAKRGLNVLVLERAPLGSDTLSTHALMRGGAVLLRRWGLLDRIAAAGTPAIRRTQFHYGANDTGANDTGANDTGDNTNGDHTTGDDDTVTVSIKPAAGVDALYAPRRTLLDRVLVDAAIAAGAQVRFGVDVTGLERDSAGRVIGVVGRDRRGEPLRAHGWLTVGADGARSLVAREVDAATVRTGVGSGAIVYGHWVGLDVTGYEWFYRPGASAGLIPTNDGAVCVFAGTSTHRFQRELAGDIRAGYLRLLKEVTGADARLGSTPPPRRLHAHPGRPSYVRKPWGPGWALVGDAGLYLDPLSTHGITDALRDAQLLSNAVAAVLRGEEEVTAFSQYEARRDHIAGPMFSSVDQLASYRWSVPTVRRLLLELSSAMSDEVDALSALRADA